MRIGLDFRFLALERFNVVRGIPRFTQEQLHCVLALDDANDYLLLCDPGTNLGPLRPEIRSAPNVRVVFADDAAPVPFGPGDETATLLARFSAYLRWVERLRLDVYHSTCPFWVSRLIMPGFDVCPYVATAYDLSPLLYPAQIPPEYADAYERGLLFLEGATRVAAISNTTARGLVEHVGVRSDRIDLTLPAISPCFRPLPEAVARSILSSLRHPARRSSRRRVDIPPEFVLSVTDLNYTKNVFTLLNGYASLPKSTRSAFPLVIAGHLPDGHAERIETRARSLAVASDVILTGRVSDDELVALYNGARVMVCPSHHEGFGLTVAEAMRCGAPVITTNRSALPEVAGDAAILVDSEDPSAFTDALGVVLHDVRRCDEMRNRGLAQAARYTTTGLGRATRDCYARAASHADSVVVGAPSRSAVRVAIWSPIAPQNSDTSMYTEDLVAGLAMVPGLHVDLFVEDGVLPSLDLARTIPVHHWSDFQRSDRHAPYDVTIYQLDASALQEHAVQAMVTHPGIAVLHDGLGVDDLSVDQSFCYVALSPPAAAAVQWRQPSADVQVIPAGVRDSLRDGFRGNRAMARAYLELDPNSFVILAPGPVDPANGIDSIVRATAALLRAGIDALLVIVGRAQEPAAAARNQSLADGLGIAGAVRLTGPVPQGVFDAYMTASDAVVVLRDPALGDAPDAVLRACAAGRCLVLSDVAAFASILDAACIRLPYSPDEDARVTSALLLLARDPARRSAMERGARAHYVREARLEPMIDRYQRLIRARARRDTTGSAPRISLPILRPPVIRPASRPGALPYSKVCEVEDFANSQLHGVIRAIFPFKRAVFGPDFPTGREHRGDWEAAMAVRTLSEHHALHSDARVLCLAAGAAEALAYVSSRAGEVTAVDLRAARRDEMSVLPYVDQAFDAIVCFAPAWLVGDVHRVAALAYELGRVVRPGGVLSWSTDVLLASDPDNVPLGPGTAPLSQAELTRFVVEASGLETVDSVSFSASHWTLSTARDADAARAAWRARRAARTDANPCPEWAAWDSPHIVLQQQGHRYTSAHVTLRRGGLYPVVDNDWARPSRDAGSPSGLAYTPR